MLTLKEIHERIKTVKTDEERLSLAEQIPWMYWPYISDMMNQCSDPKIKGELHHLAVRGYRMEEISTYGEC